MRPIFALVTGVLAVVAAAVACSPSTTFHPTGFGGGTSSAETGTANGGSSTTGIVFDAGNGDSATCAGATTCAAQGVECGPIGDGCGGTLQCGTCTVAGQSCGGGGVSGKCGAMKCVAKTCAQLGANCGPIGDGCGNQLDCGMCTVTGQTCGGGGTASVCGSGTTCKSLTCAQQAVNCGPVGDGCGNSIDCGTCTGNQTCGGGGIPSVCGSAPCTAKTCAQQNISCGPTGDGCGNILQCGTCGLPQTCGGAGMASVCGVPPSCTGLCLQQTSCSSPSVTTTITGTVYAPNGTDPLPNALVYVPNGGPAPTYGVQPFTPGVSCDNCASTVTGSPLVSAVTAVDGTFTISNMPVGTSIPLVIQLGRWRRQVTIPAVASCANTKVSATLTRLPRTQAEGDIPLMAFSTGVVDALECVMRKIGIADTEFTSPTGGGRIHLYEGLDDTSMAEGAEGGAVAPGGSPTEDQLWTTQAELNRYDMVLFPCQQNQTTRTTAAQQNLVNYANAGGRVFATHFSYIWLYQDAFSSTAGWQVEQHPSPPDQTGYIDQSFPKGQLLAQWLQIVHASTILGQIPLQIVRHDQNGPIAPAQSWMTIDDSVFPGANVHYTFNTPLNAPAAQQCGRVLFDDFHVENVGDAEGLTFPAECIGSTMTPQEKLLEFMIFDLSSCVTPDQPPACQKTTCAALGVQCGPAGDGCGGLLQCGNCTTAGQTCGGGGTPSMCGAPTCIPETCQAQHIACGPAGDGCGNQIECGSCPSGQFCGGGGMPGVCGMLQCTPKSCAAQGIQCGPAGDGCGGLLQCGSCPTGETCGGGGKPGVCGTYQCTPKTCAELGANCGPVGDGCGNEIQCGTCSAPQTCGGGGKASVCGGSGPI